MIKICPRAGIEAQAMEVPHEENRDPFIDRLSRPRDRRFPGEKEGQGDLRRAEERLLG
jgi:hypothetical protein